MNWITNALPPKIRSLLKRDTPENLWIKCPESGQLVFHKDLEANQFVIPDSGCHMPIKPRDRLRYLLDDGAFVEFKTPEVTVDPLKFRDVKRYTDRLKEYRTKTGHQDSIVAGTGTLEGQAVTIAVQDFGFHGGTLGMAAGESIIAAMENAVKDETPFIIFTASGGARMQEGMFSLMQMPRTIVAVRKLRAAKLPYIVVLTNPTTGGVTASYAMLGDIHIAEPGAVIGFAGARVIEQTIREQLPEGFQRAEYLKDHGMVDMVVPRTQMRTMLARLCRMLSGLPALEQREDGDSAIKLAGDGDGTAEGTDQLQQGGSGAGTTADPVKNSAHDVAVEPADTSAAPNEEQAEPAVAVADAEQVPDTSSAPKAG